MLLLAAAIAVAASSVCAYALVSSVSRAHGLDRNVAPVPDPRAGSTGHLTRMDWRICQAKARDLDAYRVLPGAKGNPYFLTTRVARSPSAIVPAEPKRPDLAPWRFRYFATYLDVGQVDLNARTAVITFTVLGYAPPARYGTPLSFPLGTELALNIVSRTSGASTSPLGQSLQSGGFARVSQIVPLVGSPSRYPDDSYAVNFTGVSILATIPGRPQTFYPLDIAPVAFPSSGDGQAQLTAYPGFVLILPDGERCGVEPALILTRQEGRSFVWIMSMVPLVLLVLMLRSALYARRHADSVDPTVGSLEPLVAVEAAVAFLSILPLRAVLVPNTVTGVTRVDYVLGLQLGLLVLILVLRSWGPRASRERRPDSAGTEPD